MQITRKNILKGGFAILGAILLGAIGSGVWEGLLGPALRALRNWILDSISLVFLGYKNSVYVEIARDHTSAVNMASHSLLMTLFLAMCAAYILYFFRYIREAEIQFENVVRRSEAVLQGKAQEQKTTAQLVAEIEQMTKVMKGTMKGMWKLLYVISAVMVLVLAMNFVNFARLSYIDSALVHYHQVLRITSPHLKPDEKLAVESQFALIQTKQDYAQLVGRLSAIAKEQGQSVPNFDPW